MTDGRLVLLSRQLGRPVTTRSGSPLGRVADLTVRLDTPHPRVHRVLVRRGRHRTSMLSWSQALDAAPNGPLRVAPEAAGEPDTPGLLADELLLGRDVLDTQVVDLKGHRLSRVSDVLLLHLPGGGLELIAVDLGLRALVRRIAPHPLRSGPTGSPDLGVAVDWQDLHLSSDRGHVTQLCTADAGFRRLRTTELAELLARLTTPKAVDVLQAVEPAHAAAAVHTSDPVTGRRLLAALSPEQAERLLAAAHPAHARQLRALVGAATRPRRRLLRTAGWRARRPPQTDAETRLR